MSQYKVASRFTYDDNRTFVREHVLVAEKMLGRKLNNGEVVHHKDRNKSNNDPSNLMIFASKADHSAYHKGLDIHYDGELWHAIKQEHMLICEYCGSLFTSSYRRHNYKHTYCSKQCANYAQMKAKRLTKEELLHLIKSYNGNLCAVGRELGITDNSVRKRCKTLGLPTKSSYYYESFYIKQES